MGHYGMASHHHMNDTKHSLFNKTEQMNAAYGPSRQMAANLGLKKVGGSLHPEKELTW